MNHQDSFEVKVNNKVRFYFEQLEKKLNKNSIPFELQPGNIYHCFQIQSLGEVIRIPSNADVFRLPPAKSDSVKDVQVNKDETNKILIRRFLGYTAASRIEYAENEEQVEKILNPLITEMLMSLENELGYSYKTVHHGNYASFTRPGHCEHVPTIIFKEMDDMAACELRLYSDTFPAINIKDSK